LPIADPIDRRLPIANCRYACPYRIDAVGTQC
jgi:hypothetical protein